MEDKLPVIIVGKDRTRMTIEVAKSFIECSNIDTQLIIVSDRSMNGHIEAIKDNLKEYNPIILSTTSTQYGLGGAMNIGIKEALKYNDSFLLSENDYIAHRNIDFKRYLNLVRNSDMCILSLKPVNSGGNIKGIGYIYDDNWYMISERGDSSKTSYSIDIGCSIIHKRFLDYYGYFSDNVSPSNVENDIIVKHQNMTYEFKQTNKILRGFDVRDLRCVWYDKSGPIYHIGLNGTNGKHAVNFPDEYIKFSDINQDINICNKYVK